MYRCQIVCSLVQMSLSLKCNAGIVREHQGLPLAHLFSTRNSPIDLHLEDGIAMVQLLCFLMNFASVSGGC